MLWCATRRLDEDEGARIKITHPQNPEKLIEVNAINEPWFVAVDVCKALELNPNATRRLEDDEKAALRLTQTSSNGVTQERDVIAVNEPGLYSLVLGSRKLFE